MTAEAGQPEVYPNLQVVLTRPIDWQVYHRLTLGHGSGRDDFETLKAITFLTSLLSSNQLPKSSFVRAARGTHAARVRHEPSGESMAPKGRRNAGSLNSTVASRLASTSSRTAFPGTMETPFSISTARLTSQCYQTPARASPSRLPIAACDRSRVASANQAKMQ